MSPSKTFHYYGGGTEDLRNRNGQRVDVLRKLTHKECDPEAGSMFRVRFPDGHEADAFEEELRDE